MGLSPEEIRRARLSKSSSSKEKVAIISGGGNSLEMRKAKMEGLKRSISDEDIDSRLKSLQARAVETASEVLEERRKEKVEIVFIFDKSGSCEGTEETTISGFLDIISHEQSEQYNDVVTTVLFDNTDMTIHDRVPISNVIGFSYRASGGTALYDTVCKVIEKVKNRQKKDSDIVKRTLVVIMTDGYDEHSMEKTASDVNRIITERRSAGWEFIYLGAQLDAEFEAERLGISSGNAVRYEISNTANNFKAIRNALDDMHSDGHVNDDWSKPITDPNHMLGSSDGPVKRLKRGRS